MRRGTFMCLRGGGEVVSAEGVFVVIDAVVAVNV